MKRDDAAAFVLERVRSDNPASWPAVYQQARKSFGKTTVYDALKALRKSGQVIKDRELLWAITPELEHGWRIIDRILERWSLVRNRAIPLENRVAAARPLARMIRSVERLPFSGRLVRELREGVPLLEDEVLAEVLPMLQELVRAEAENRFVGVPRGADSQGDLKYSIWPTLRRRLNGPLAELEYVIGFESLLLELIRHEWLTSHEVDRVATWLVDKQLVGAASREEYLNRWQSLTPLTRELLRRPRIRRRLHLRFAGVPQENLGTKPWLSELGALLLAE